MTAQAGAGARGGQGAIWPELKDGSPGPLYGIFSREEFLLGQAVGGFLHSPAFATNPDLNVERFQAGQAKPHHVLESARTIPFLGTRRLVLVSEADNFKAPQLAEFLDYLKSPTDSTCLVFTGHKLDMRTKFAKLLKKNGKLRELKPLYPNQLPAWLKERAAVRGKDLAGAAAAHLAELAGLGLGALDSEVEKLALYVGRKKTIEKDEVLKVLGKGRLYSIFDFTDALAAGDLARALSAWDQLSALGEPPVKVLAMVTRLFRQLTEVHQVLESGGRPQDVQRKLRIPPAATRTLTARARTIKAGELGKSFENILEADVSLKSSSGSDRVIMERLIMDLCAG